MGDQELISKIEQAATLADLQAIAEHLRQVAPITPDVQNALLQKLITTNADSRTQLEQAKAALAEIKATYSPTEWVSATEYAKQFGLGSRMVVTNWIARGVIPPDCVREIPEWGTRLVRAIPYEPRKYDNKK